MHARKELDSVSDISAVSSNRKLMIQAKMDLEKRLLAESRIETKIARLRIEALQEDENDIVVEMTGQLDQSDDKLERDLSLLITEDQNNARAAERRHREDAERNRAELAGIASQKRMIQEEYAVQQQNIKSVFEQQQAVAQQEARAEADRVFKLHVEKESAKQQTMLQEVRQHAERQEINAVLQFAEKANETHQAQLTQALGEAQSMGQEKLAFVIEECDQQHRALMKNEESVLRDKAYQFVAESEQHAAQELQAQKHHWEQQAQEATLSIQREAERRWSEQEAAAQNKFREQAQKLFDMEKAFKDQQAVIETHFMTVHHQRRMEQEHAKALLLDQNERIKDLEAKLASGNASRPTDISFSAPSPRQVPAFPTFKSPSSKFSPQSGGVPVFKMDSPRQRKGEKPLRSPKEQSPYEVDDWTALPQTSKASQRDAEARSVAMAMTRGNAAVRSTAVSARATPLRSKSATPAKQPSEAPSRQSRQAAFPTAKPEKPKKETKKPKK